MIALLRWSCRSRCRNVQFYNHECLNRFIRIYLFEFHDSKKSIWYERFWFSSYFRSLWSIHQFHSLSYYITICPKYTRQTLVLVWNSALREKFNFNFSTVFLIALTEFSFREVDWALDYNSMKFWDFPDIS